MYTVRFYFDLPESEGEIIASDFKSIKVMELASYGDPTGTEVGTYPILAGVDYVEATSEDVEDEFHWFKLIILSASAEVICESDPVIAETTSVKVNSIRTTIKDTSITAPAFTDEDLLSKIRLAAVRYNNVQNLSRIPERMWAIIELLVRIDICHVLAFDYAKYLRLEIPGGATLGRDELYTHYLEVASKLEEYYKGIKDDLQGNLGEGGEDGSAIHVSSLERDSGQTGYTESELGVKTDVYGEERDIISSRVG